MANIQGARQTSVENAAIASGYGILDRDFRKKLGMKVPKFTALSVFRELKGRMEPARAVKRHTTYAYEEGDWRKAAITIAAKSNSGSNVLITLSSGDHYETGTKSYPIVGNLVMFEDETVGYISAIDRTTPSAHVLTVKPYAATELVQTAAVVGGTIVCYGNIQKEKSTKTEMRVPFISKIEAYIHTSRANYAVTDWAQQNEVEFEYDGQKYLYVKGIEEGADNFAADEEGNMLFTPANDGTLTDAGGNALKGATGLIPQTTSSGMNFEYDIDFEFADFQDLQLLITDNYGDTEYLFGRGTNLSNSMDRWLIDFTDGGAYYNFFDKGKDQALNFDFKSISVGGVTFHNTTWQSFSHAGSYGAGNMPWRHMGVLIPCGNTRDPELNKNVPYLQMQYAPPKGAAHTIQGDFKVWETGADAAGRPTSDEEVREIHWISYKTLFQRNREKFGIVRKSLS